MATHVRQQLNTLNAMLINSLAFWIFFSLTILVYYMIKNCRWQNAWLALASLFFYGCVDLELLTIFIVIIALFYTLAITIEKNRNASPLLSKWLKVAGVCAGIAARREWGKQTFAQNAESGLSPWRIVQRSMP